MTTLRNLRRVVYQHATSERDQEIAAAVSRRAKAERKKARKKAKKKRRDEPDGPPES